MVCRHWQSLAIALRGGSRPKPTHSLSYNEQRGQQTQTTDQDLNTTVMIAVDSTDSKLIHIRRIRFCSYLISFAYSSIIQWLHRNWDN